MLNRIAMAFMPTQAARASSQKRKSSVREIVRAHSHGNIRLQWGQYYTKQDVEAKRARLRDFKFVD